MGANANAHLAGSRDFNAMIDVDDSDSVQSPNFNEYDIGNSSDGRMYKKMMDGLGMSPGQ